MSATRRALSKIPQPLGMAGSWVLAFYDDFDGAADASPNGNKWTHWLQNQVRRDAYNLSTNAYLDGASNLVIRTKSDPDVAGSGKDVSAGGVQSITQYGPNAYVEIIAKTPDPAWFVAWWRPENGMNGINTPPDPADGSEVDVIEKFDGGAASSNRHHGGYGANHVELGLSSFGATETNFNRYGYRQSTGQWVFNGSVVRTDTTIITTRTDNWFRLTHEYELAMGSITTDRLAYIDRICIWVPA